MYLRPLPVLNAEGLPFEANVKSLACFCTGLNILKAATVSACATVQVAHHSIERIN